ncbi:hypothetical protein LTR36_006031 [Oleoguttula mirabilis]|uniref:Uncharacterized protein n=1 Tax=Oleoguttula mirabilis TaxID=1507867 RepID=A0AAV9JD35_9PEZI|nr:hypothetical protein LTR36_006031 [Oleoguttula mirabilis]
MHKPSTLTAGYFDGMGLLISTGDSFQTIAKALPGFKQVEYADRFLTGMDTIWGGGGGRVDFPAALFTRLEQRSFIQRWCIHVWMFWTSPSARPTGTNDQSPSGISEGKLKQSQALTPGKTEVIATNACSFDPNLSDGGTIAGNAVEVIMDFVRATMQTEQIWTRNTERRSGGRHG